MSQITVGDLKEFIENLPDDMKVFVVSDDERPVEKVIDLGSEIRTGYYKELYLEIE